MEPVRNLIVGKGQYYEAVAKHVDVQRKQLVACFPADAGLDEACFQISYDVLVVAVGSVNNTFGIQVRPRTGCWPGQRALQRALLQAGEAPEAPAR